MYNQLPNQQVQPATQSTGTTSYPLHQCQNPTLIKPTRRVSCMWEFRQIRCHNEQRFFKRIHKLYIMTYCMTR